MTDPSGGSMVLGVVLGLAAAAIGSFVPLMADSLDSVWFGAIWMFPLVLVVGLVLANPRSTRRTGGGMLVGLAVGFVVFAGPCIVWFNTAGG